MTSASILPSGGKRDVVQLIAWSPFAGHILKVLCFSHDPFFVGSPATGAKKLSDISEETESRKPMDNDAGAVCIVQRDKLSGSLFLRWKSTHLWDTTPCSHFIRRLSVSTHERTGPGSASSLSGCVQ